MGHLDVVLADRSRGGAGLVTIRYTFPPAVVGLVVGAIGLGLLVWWLSVPGHFPTWLVFLVVVLPNAFRQSRDARLALTDPVLAEGAARAALALGTEVKPGTWRITGPQARVLNRELRRLHNWWTPQTGDAAVTAAAREQRLLAEANPDLRAFLAPTRLSPPELEPRVADVRSHADGEPWPVLGDGPQEWPVLPPRQP